MTPQQQKEIERCVSLLAAGYSAADMRELGHAEGAVREAIRRAVEAGRVPEATERHSARHTADQTRGAALRTAGRMSWPGGFGAYGRTIANPTALIGCAISAKAKIPKV